MHINISCLFTLLTWFLSVNTAHSNLFSGHVYDVDTGNAISNALVTVGNGYWPPLGTIYQTNTDAVGCYEVSGLPSATDYTILTSFPGYESSRVQMKSSPSVIDFKLSRLKTGFLVRTINEGLRNYITQSNICYRPNGTVNTNTTSLFPQIEEGSAEISNFLIGISANTNLATSAIDIWEKCSTVWGWLKINSRYATSDPLYQEAKDYMMQAGWPSIARIASTFNIYGFIPWGTCMSRAQIMATLLYRVGVPKDLLAVAETLWELRYSQHMYVIIRMEDRWVYVDPTHITKAFPPFSSYTSVPVTGGGQQTDYCHPHKLSILLGSSLSYVPEITGRTNNNSDVFILSPPNGTVTTSPVIPVSGITHNSQVTTVAVNSVQAPVNSGIFECLVTLAPGTNIIVAVAPGNTDAITVTYTPTPPVICSTNPLPSGVVGTVYNQALIASGGELPYTWSVISGDLPSGLSVVETTGVITGIPSVATVADFCVQVVGNNNLFSGQSFNLTIRHSAYGAWRVSRFVPDELIDSSVSGDGTDPDGDGITNLMEYALDLDPKVASVAGMPTMASTNGYLTLIYRKNKQATDITYLVEATGALNSDSWSTNGLTIMSTVDSNTYWLITVRDAVPVSIATNRFMRLKVIK